MCSFDARNRGSTRPPSYWKTSKLGRIIQNVRIARCGLGEVLSSGWVICRGTAQMGDDESCVGDGICCEGGCVLASHRGAQPLGRPADGKRERGVLLNVP